MPTGSTEHSGGRAKRWPIFKNRDGTLQGQYVALSEYGATASPSDPGSATKSANNTALTNAVAAARSAGHNTVLVDGQYFISSAPTYIAPPIILVGRNPKTHPTYTGAVPDGLIGDNDATGSGSSAPRVGVVFGNSSGTVYTDRAEAYGVAFEVVGGTGRSDGSFGTHGLSWRNCGGGVAQDCFIRGASGAGFIIHSGGENYLIMHNTVSNVLADGIHANRCDNVIVDGNQIDGCGDDFLAYVNNAADPPHSGATFRYNFGRNQSTSGGGLKVDGGSNVLFSHNVIHEFYNRAMSIQPTSTYNGHYVSDVRCEYNTFTRNKTGTNAEFWVAQGRSTDYYVDGVTFFENVGTQLLGRHGRAGITSAGGNYTRNVVVDGNVSMASTPATPAAGNTGIEVNYTENFTIQATNRRNKIIGVVNSGFTCDVSAGAGNVLGTWSINGLDVDTMNTAAAANTFVLRIADVVSGSITIQNVSLLSTYGTSESAFFLSTNYNPASGARIVIASCSSTDSGGVNTSGASNWATV